MIEQLRIIMAKHKLTPRACRELEEHFAIIAPRTPTLRLDDTAATRRAWKVIGEQDFHRRYQIDELIGLGGFSEVHSSWDRHMKRTVALKVQHSTRTSEDDRASFRQEVRITAQLQHPGVVPIYDWGALADGRMWFTMKRVRGDTIKKRIEMLHMLNGSEWVRALRRLLEDFRRLCEPVAYAHARGIIHRDLSPQNLMIGEFGEVHVMDWGLARHIPKLGDTEASSDSHQNSRSVGDPTASQVRTRAAGTPYYMPPEQARGQIAAMGPRSDVYALGAVLYEILSGAAPYTPKTRRKRIAPEVILQRVLRGPPKPIRRIARSEAPEELAQLCARAMARRPSKRPATAEKLMEDLRDWLEGANRQARAYQIVKAANEQHRTRIETMRAEATLLRATSRRKLGQLRSFDRAQDKAEGWKLDDDAADLEHQALREETRWTQKLQSALNDAPEFEEAHLALADHYSTSLLQAESLHDEPTVTSLSVLLQHHVARLPPTRRIRYEALLRGEGELSLVTNPPARAYIKPYESKNRYLTVNEEKAHNAMTPIRRMVLPRGSYLILLKAPNHREVRYPVLIDRNKHWNGVRPGSTTALPIELPKDGELEPDEMYVPAGWFTAGGDPRAGEGLPQLSVWVDAFIIQRHPVTNAEYVKFLNALVDDGRPLEAQAHCPSQAPGKTMDAQGGHAYFVNEQTGHYSLRHPEADGTLPAVFVDWRGAASYAQHLSETTGLPWRLPSEFEWEKAARGVDGRFMPWGDQVEPTWACVAGSHPEPQRVMSVHEYATDVSPYGIRGMAGNVRDWCIEQWSHDGPPIDAGILRVEKYLANDNGHHVIRGGAWISVGDLTRLSVRYSEPTTNRHGALGFRLARTL